jgi:hypothetical protein
MIVKRMFIAAACGVTVSHTPYGQEARVATQIRQLQTPSQ